MNGNIVNKLYYSLNFRNTLRNLYVMICLHILISDFTLSVLFRRHLYTICDLYPIPYYVLSQVSYRTKHSFENVPHARAVVINCMILSSWYRSPYCVFVRWCGIVSVHQLNRCCNAKRFKVRLFKPSDV